MPKHPNYPAETEALMVLHSSHLSEKDYRRYIGLEASKLGYGGKSYLSRLFGVSRPTIDKGIAELNGTDLGLIPSNRQRKAGGGRKKNLR